MKRSGDRRGGERDVEAEAREEVEAHLSMQVADLRAEGWSEEAAGVEAMRRFGDRVRVEREMAAIDASVESGMKRARVIGDVWQDVRVSLRQLARRPGFAAVTVGVLGLGIGANAAVFALVDGALLRPLPLAMAERLVFLHDVQAGEPGYPASVPELDDWRRDADFTESMLGYATNRYAVTGEGAAEAVVGVLVRGDAAGVLGLEPVIGRWFDVDEVETSAAVLMLSEWYWRGRLGGRVDVVGTTLRLDGQPYTVIGVIPDASQVLLRGQTPEVWLPMAQLPFMTRGLHFARVVGRLRAGVTLTQARERATAIADALRESGVTRHGLALRPVREELVGDARAQLLILMGAVMVVLLVVCANVANLLLTRAMGRQREFALRSALGSGRMRLIRQVLAETVVLATLGGLAGLAVAYVVRDGVNAVSSTAGALAPRTVMDVRVVLYTGGIALLVALLAGLMPAAGVMRGSLVRAIDESGAGWSAGSRSAMRRRRLLVGLEFALSVMLVAGAGLLVRSMAKLVDQDTGFEADNVLTFQLVVPQARYTEERIALFYSDLQSSLARLPGVEAVGLGSHLPLGGGDTNGSFEIVGRTFPEGESPSSKKRIVTPGYFQALGIPLVRGRTFRASDRAGSPDVVIVTEAVAALYWPGEDALGRRIRFSWGPGEEQEIVGIVGDVKHDGLDRPVEGMIFRPAGQFTQPGMTAVVRTAGDPLTILESVRSEVAALDPDLPVQRMRTMESVVAGSVGSRRTTMRLMAGFAILALILSAVGMYAVTAQSMAQRTREIGVRMAIGARGGDVMRMVFREELPVLMIGLLAGLAGASAATRVLDAWLFGISAHDPVTFAGSTALLLAVAVAAILVPSRRAATLDPVQALRTD
jgi:putative ABC transport system permease protein